MSIGWLLSYIILDTITLCYSLHSTFRLIEYTSMLNVCLYSVKQGKVVIDNMVPVAGKKSLFNCNKSYIERKMLVSSVLEQNPLLTLSPQIIFNRYLTMSTILRYILTILHRESRLYKRFLWFFYSLFYFWDSVIPLFSEWPDSDVSQRNIYIYIYIYIYVCVCEFSNTNWITNLKQRYPRK